MINSIAIYAKVYELIISIKAFCISVKQNIWELQKVIIHVKSQIIIFIFIVSCGVKNNIERQSRQEVHDNEIGTFQIQKDWKKKQLDDDKECYLSPDNQKSICYTTF